MAKQFSRRDILRAIALGGGVVAGELWWPGKQLISIASEPVWVDPFGLAPIKAEGARVLYDPALNEDNLEQMCIELANSMRHTMDQAAVKVFHNRDGIQLRSISHREMYVA